MYVACLGISSSVVRSGREHREKGVWKRNGGRGWRKEKRKRGPGKEERLTLGNTLCPPHGDMSRPKDRGKVSQFAGNKKVFAGSISEQGEVCLVKQSMTTMRTTAKGEKGNSQVVSQMLSLDSSGRGGSGERNEY